jgi:hypothetical protein
VLRAKPQVRTGSASSQEVVDQQDLTPAYGPNGALVRLLPVAKRAPRGGVARHPNKRELVLHILMIYAVSEESVLMRDYENCGSYARRRQQPGRMLRDTPPSGAKPRPRRRESCHDLGGTARLCVAAGRRI